LTTQDFQSISELRYQMRRFLRSSERAVRRAGTRRCNTSCSSLHCDHRVRRHSVLCGWWRRRGQFERMYFNRGRLAELVDELRRVSSPPTAPDHL